MLSTVRLCKESRHISSSQNFLSFLKIVAGFNHKSPLFLVAESVVTVTGWYRTKRPMHCDHFPIMLPLLSFNHS
jgi:Rps23 Pro-64 3,4-dihydroxylase Tpa1-like proline 4-hydroxylase